MQIGAVVGFAVQFFTQPNAAPAAGRPPLAQEIRNVENDPEALVSLGRRRRDEVQSLLQEARVALPGASQDRINSFAASLISVGPSLFAALHDDSGQGQNPFRIPAYSQSPRPGETTMQRGPGPVLYSAAPFSGHHSLEGSPGGLPSYAESLSQGHRVA
jgi:hypothetical protein